MIIQNITRIKTCNWCGRTFRVPRTRKYNAVKYCCKKHSEFAKKEQNLQAQRKYQKKYAWLLKDADKWRLGGVKLGATPEKDFKKEAEAIRKELRRTGL